MSVRVSVQKNLKGIPIKINQMKKLGQYALANQVHADMDQYVPKLSGDLRTQSAVSNDGKSIYYNAPYARRRFYEPARRYTTPGTTARWDLKAKAIHGKSWERIVKKAMR